MFGLRPFASKNFAKGSEPSSRQFNFPNHKELFADHYYDEAEGDTQNPYERQAKGPLTLGDDYQDPNKPFVSEDMLAPGGILKHYKKRINVTAQDVMEQDYMNALKDLGKQASKYMGAVGQNEQDMINHTKSYVQRQRLNRQIDFSDDFRKRFMTKEYGNYEKYDKNSIEQVTSKGTSDSGLDTLQKNMHRMHTKLDGAEKDKIEADREKRLEDVIGNQSYAHSTISDIHTGNVMQDEHAQQIKADEEQLKLARNFESQEIQYIGRLSPIAKQEIYLNYQKGMTIKDLSLKYGILPQRVKAIIFQKHVYWYEVYPKMGETHGRMALEREGFYAQEFPFVDYGVDLQLMAKMEQGIRISKVKRSSIDANPPKHVRDETEKKLSEMRSRKSDRVPIGFIGKGAGGYILKDWVIHRGPGAPQVSKHFKDAVRLTGSQNELQLPKFRLQRMKAGGPRYAAMGARKY